MQYLQAVSYITANHWIVPFQCNYNKEPNTARDKDSQSGQYILGFLQPGAAWNWSP